MAKHDRDTLKLLMKLIGHKTGEISNVEFSPQKPVFPKGADLHTSLLRCRPEEVGVDSAFILDLFKNLMDENSCHLHKIMVLRHARVIGELYPVPYERDVWHVTHSMCKSVTGMAIGFLISEGKLSLDDKISDIFSNELNLLKMLFSSNITVRHLLTMTSGVSFNESGAVSGNDWKKLFFESQQKNAPGAVFEYNSMNSYMLSAIVTKITGENMVDYLRPRLFEPLDIQNVFWESCPQGITKGGWGMFLGIEDMAKLGLLYLNKGRYNGEQILPEEWVLDAVTPHVETGKEGSPAYGYQLWCGDDREGAYTFNGMLGQNVYIYPDVDMMIVTNAGNDDLFQSGNMSRIIKKAMSDIKVYDDLMPISEDTVKNQKRLDSFIHENMSPVTFAPVTDGGWRSKKLSFVTGRARKKTRKVLSERTSSFFYGLHPVYKRMLFKKLSGAVYDMDDTGVGLLPLLMQIMHNNYTDGISSIGFLYEESEDAFYLIINEGEITHKIRCSDRSNPHYNDLDEHGEIYRLCVIALFSSDEYGRPVIRCEFYFVEDSTVRIMNIYLGKREPLQHDNYQKVPYEIPMNIGIRFDEIPGSSMLFGIMDQFGGLDSMKGINGIVLNWLNEYGAMDALTLAIRDTVRPKLHGTLHLEVESFDETEYDYKESENINDGYDQDV